MLDSLTGNVIDLPGKYNYRNNDLGGKLFTDLLYFEYGLETNLKLNEYI